MRLSGLCAIAALGVFIGVPDAAAIEAPVGVSEAVSPTEADADDALPFKLSLPTQKDFEGWREAGFRIELGMNYGWMQGLYGAPSGRLLGAVLRVGARLDRDWSLLGSFQYTSASRISGLSGLRFSGTLDPTWHLSDHLQVAMGVGFGGMVEGRTGRPDPNPTDRTNLADSYTYPTSRTPLPSCNGIGVAGLVRTAWQSALGPMSALTIFGEVDGQWTQCEERLGRVDPDTARPFIRRQYWPHVLAHAGVTFGWR